MNDGDFPLVNFVLESQKLYEDALQLRTDFLISSSGLISN